GWTSPDRRRRRRGRAYLGSLAEGHESTCGRAVAELLQRDNLAEHLNRNPSLLAPLLPTPEGVFQAIAADDWVTARGCFETMFAEARWLHDLLFRHSWAVMTALGRLRGQAVVEEGLRRVLTSSSFYEAAWEQSQNLTPAQQAVVLAEHLRLHFSGPDGTGSVRVIEEEDRYRLVLDPCGSGGAMRRALKGRPEFASLPEGSPLTWGRAGQVPAYCAHCAVNELESLRRRGHLEWVTEFDPDPDRPCGWTLFKDRSRTPEAYLKRLQ
ncbi:MAG: hypothetical protein AB1758_27995, partial [Candidatus Eremiobacterota bacterium]